MERTVWWLWPLGVANHCGTLTVFTFSSDSFFQFLYFIWNIVSFGLPFCLNFVIKLSIASFDRQEDCCSYQPTYILDARSGKDLAHE